LCTRIRKTSSGIRQLVSKPEKRKGDEPPRCPLGRIRDMKRRSRRRWFPVVNRSLQFRFLATILVYGGLTILVLGTALFLPDFFLLSDDTLDFQTKIRASEVILAIHQRLWVPVIALLIVIGAHFFRIFHRVVGPLYRFRWAFGEIAKGNLALTVRIRQDDFLHLEEAALNDMINSVSEKLSSVHKATESALTSLDRFERLLPSDQQGAGEAEIRQSLREHRQALEAVKEKMGAFNLDKEGSPLPKAQLPSRRMVSPCFNTRNSEGGIP